MSFYPSGLQICAWSHGIRCWDQVSYSYRRAKLWRQGNGSLVRSILLCIDQSPQVDRNSFCDRYFHMISAAAVSDVCGVYWWCFNRSVLNELYNHAGNRLIILSTFDPDVALLLRLKQPRFPVCFLTESAGPIKTPDPRRASLHHAIQWARAIHCWGIVTECWPIIHAPELVELVSVLSSKWQLVRTRSGLHLWTGEIRESLEAYYLWHS